MRCGTGSCVIGRNVTGSRQARPVTHPTVCPRASEDACEERIDVKEIDISVVIHVIVTQPIAARELTDIGTRIEERQIERVDIEKVDFPIAIGITRCERRALPQRQQIPVGRWSWLAAICCDLPCSVDCARVGRDS